MGYMPGANETFDDIKFELVRQHSLWGTQDHPSVPKAGEPTFFMPAEATAKLQCEFARRHGRMTWAHILVEEVAEAANAPTPDLMIEELVQVAAVAVSWIDSIKRNERGA